MAEKTEIETQQTERPSFAIGSVLILVLTLLVYFPSLRGEFLWDDDILLTHNQHIKAPASEGLSAIWFSSNQPDYLPLTSTSFWFEWRLWGMNPTGYRVVNLLLHAMNAILFWRVLRLLKIPGAFLAGLIFAVHPVCVASVAWIAERKNTLSMLFFLLSLFCFVKQPRSNESRITNHVSRWYWFSLVTFLLALLSKGSVVMLPMVLLLLVWWQVENSRASRVEGRETSTADASARLSTLVPRLLPFFALSALFAAITIWFQFQRSIGEQAVVNQLGLFEKVVAAFWAIGFYFSKAIWPTSLAMIYPQWEFKGHFIFYCIPVLALVVGLISTWRFWRSHARHVFFAFGYFVLMLAPILGFVNMYFLTYSRVADHWQYLALLGLIAVIAASIQYSVFSIQSSAQRGLHILLKWILPLGIVGVLSVLSWQRAAVFSTSETLWNDTLAKNPNCWAAHAHLGNIFSERGKHDEAAQQFTEALALKPDFADAHFNLANSLVALGDVEKATLHFTEAIRFKPRYPEAHYNFGLLLQRQGKFDDALSHYLEAIRINPAHPGAHNNAGNLLAQSGRDAEAAEHYETALRLNPNLPEAQNNLANVLQRMGKVEESVPHYLQAIALKPDYADAHKNLAIALKTLGKPEEAAAHLREALRLRPDLSDAQEMLKNILNNGN